MAKRKSEMVEELAAGEEFGDDGLDDGLDDDMGEAGTPMPGVFIPGGASDYGSPEARATRVSPFKAPPATSPPLWAGAVGQGATAKLQVQRVINGHPEDLGYLGASAKIEDLITRWPVAGTYWITPIQVNGNKLGPTAEVNVAQDHEVLQKIAQARLAADAALQGAGNHGGSGGALSPEVMTLLSQTIADSKAREERALAMLQEERERLATERAELAREKLHLAVHNGNTVAELQNRVVDNEAQRAATASQMQLAMFSAQREADRARYEAELAAQAARAEAEQRRYERERAEERERRAGDDARREKDEERRRKDSEAAEERRREEVARERERDREFLQLQMATITARNEAGDPFKIFESVIERGGPLIAWAKEQGLIGAKEEAPSDWKSIITQGAAALAAIANAKATNDQVKLVEAGALGPVEDEDEDEGPIQGQVRVIQQGPAIPIPQQVQQAPAPLQVAPQPQLTLAEAIAALPEVLAMGPAVKEARRTIRDLVFKLRSMDKATWAEAITAAVTEHPIVINYCTAVSVHWALVEGQAEEALATAIADAVFASPLASAVDLPRRRAIPGLVGAA